MQTSYDRRFLITLMTTVVLAAVSLRGQHPTLEGPVFRSDTRLVVLHAAVVDKKGRFVTNLPQDVFTLFENGTQQQIRTFRHEDVPVSMGLIVDNSGSMRDKRAKVDAAALALVRDSNREDEVFIVNFNDEAFLGNLNGKDFTNDIKELEDALTRIEPSGGTAMRDALRMSIDHVKEKSRKEKKVLVTVTDGDDTASAITLENLVKEAQQSEVLIYAIGILSNPGGLEAQRARKALEALAKATGGAAFFPKELSEVDTIAHQVARDIRNQYTLMYSPSNPMMDNTFRQIKVTVKTQGNPKVRTRSGYYATPDQTTLTAGEERRKK